MLSLLNPFTSSESITYIDLKFEIGVN